MARPRKEIKKHETGKVELSNYAPVTPNISKMGDVVKFSRDIDARDDSMLEYLLELSNGGYSPTHTGILNLTSKMVKGEGFIPEEPNSATDNWLEKANPYESWNDLLDKMARDYAIFNACVLQVVWSKDGSKPVNFYTIPVHKVRSGDVNEFNQITHYYIKENWLANNRYWNQSILINYTQGQDKAIELPAYNPDIALEHPVQILYIRKPDNSNPYYTIPDWFASHDWIMTEKNLGVLNSASLQNGMLPNLMISVIGASPTPEEKTKFLNDLRNSFQSANNAGKFFVEFVENKDQSIVVNPIQVPNNAELYHELIEISIGAISRSHSISPELAGLVTNNATLGGDSNKISVAYQMFYNNVIVSMQNIILKYVNKLAKASGVGEITIINEQPLFLVDKDLLKSVLTTDELREVIGYEPMEQGQAPVIPNASAPSSQPVQQSVPQGNDFLSSLSGTQYRQLMRILREYNKEKISEAVAKMMLQTSFGFTDEQINTLLNGE